MNINTGNKEFKENAGSFRSAPEAMAKGSEPGVKKLACKRIRPQVLN